jgi:hypothetical protein
MGKTIGQMVAEIRQVNTALGWRADPNTFGELVALLHTEVGEATEAYRDHRLADATRPVCGRAANGEEPCPEHGPSKPEGVGSELADLVIRSLDTADVMSLPLDRDFLDFELADVAPLPTWVLAHGPATLVTFGDYMAALHRAIDRFWGTGDVPRLLRAIVTVAEKFGIDLTFEYRRKIAFNRTRPYQHGGRTLADPATPAVDEAEAEVMVTAEGARLVVRRNSEVLLDRVAPDTMGETTKVLAAAGWTVTGGWNQTMGGMACAVFKADVRSQGVPAEAVNR